MKSKTIVIKQQKSGQKSTKLTYLITCLVFCFVCVFSVVLSGNFNTQIISVGATSLQTKIAQSKLTSLGYYSGEINGEYNLQTRKAIIDFQQNNELNKSGVLDYVTAQALGVETNSQANSDLYLLAKLIYSEARGEPYIGQVAVGAVVLNRVASSDFPNTLSGVIYQPWAFTALHDGQFNLEPNSTSYQAAQDAINGWDPSYGSLYYYNPATATSAWIFTRTTITQIGNHIFAI